MRFAFGAVVLLIGMFGASSSAQGVHTVYYPGPAPVVVPTTYSQTTVYRPFLRPFSPVVTTVQRPVYVAPQPVVVAHPVLPVVSPAPRVIRTRYRPILGGTVTRAW